MAYTQQVTGGKHFHRLVKNIFGLMPGKLKQALTGDTSSDPKEQEGKLNELIARKRAKVNRGWLAKLQEEDDVFVEHIIKLVGEKLRIMGDITR